MTWIGTSERGGVGFFLSRHPDAFFIRDETDRETDRDDGARIDRAPYPAPRIRDLVAEGSGSGALRSDGAHGTTRREKARGPVDSRVHCDNDGIARDARRCARGSPPAARSPCDPTFISIRVLDESSIQCHVNFTLKRSSLWHCTGDVVLDAVFPPLGCLLCFEF